MAPARVLTSQLVLAVSALCAIVILAIFGVITGEAAGGILVSILGGFGLGARHEQNASTTTNGAQGP